jgi:hypothetical protein
VGGPAFVGGRDAGVAAATSSGGGVAPCAPLLTTAECLLQVDSVRRKMIGRVARRVNI